VVRPQVASSREILKTAIAIEATGEEVILPIKSPREYGLDDPSMVTPGQNPKMRGFFGLVSDC